MRATVIGAGLAGAEAALRLSRGGVKVTLVEMKPSKMTPAHKNTDFAELVCSNSLKAERISSAGGLLKAEMQLFDSVCVETAYKTRVPAGGALAVDRGEFARLITQRLIQDENVEILNQEADAIPDGVTVIAAGPLMSDPLARAVQEFAGEGYLGFFDAAAPIVTAESVDPELSFAASRYDRGGEDDYVNCPMNKEEYEAFYEALVSAESAELHGFDRPNVYEGCMPVEIMAKRGTDTLRFGPLKPVGLRDPRTGHRPWAVVQLRKENTAGSMYNLVGFQTNLKFPEQKRVFSMIPALHSADFMRYGVMHRNTFLCAPRVIDRHFEAKKREGLFFAGQLTGVEGYMESAASGIIAGENALRRLKGEPLLELPATTMMGALSAYMEQGDPENFQPMGANFGMLPPSETFVKDKKERYELLARRALKDMKEALL